jgi:hypothetical protein
LRVRRDAVQGYKRSRITQQALGDPLLAWLDSQGTDPNLSDNDDEDKGDDGKICLFSVIQGHSTLCIYYSSMFAAHLPYICSYISGLLVTLSFCSLSTAVLFARAS